MAFPSRRPWRMAVACLLAGFGLLNVADARWAHGLGVGCLGSFVLLAFGAIAFTAIREPSSEPATHNDISTIEGAR